jgi:Cu-Zn family superoxide dismutase
MKALALLVSAAALAACAAVPAVSTATPPPPGASAQLKAPDGAEIGIAMLQQTPTGLLIEVEVKGLTAGWHGMHIHEKGDCTAPAFTTAGAHVHGGEAARQHGFMTMSGGEPGDLPNLWVGADGVGKAQVFAPRLSLGPDSLWDRDGAALVIHAARDDQWTQPIGNSGARVACGVVSH